MSERKEPEQLIREWAREYSWEEIHEAMETLFNARLTREET